MSVRQIGLLMHACLLTALRCPTTERPISALASLRGHPAVGASPPWWMQDLAACPSGKLGSTSSPAAPRVPPGFAP